MASSKNLWQENVARERKEYKMEDKMEEYRWHTMKKLDEE
jgi:hypothetical protein